MPVFYQCLHCLLRQNRPSGKDIQPTHVFFTFNTVLRISHGAMKFIQERSLVAIQSQSIASIMVKGMKLEKAYNMQPRSYQFSNILQ